VIEQAVRTIPPARDLIAQRRGEVRDRPEAFEPLLTDLLAGPLQRADQGQRALLLIIDDLEQVLIPDQQNLHRVAPEVAPVLAAVLRAFDPAVTDSRLLLTSRYQFTLDSLPNRLEQIPLRPLSLVARLKLLTRQQAQAGTRLQAERSALAVRAAEVSRGNPGLQDLIALRLVFSDQVDTDRATAAITDMEAYLRQGDLPAEADVRKFLEDLALDTLLDLAGPTHRGLLRDLTLFDLPVPDQVVTAVAQRSTGSAARLRGLGLLGSFPDPHQPRLTATAVNMLAAGRIAPLDDDEITALAALAVTPLFAAWGGDTSNARSPLMDAELTRLALHAGNPQVTAACAAGAVRALTAGPAATAFQLGQTAIALLDQHHHPVPITLLRRTADAARVSGDGQSTLHLFGRASQLPHTDDHPQTDPLEHARVAAEYAEYLIQRGDLKHAERLLHQAHQAFTTAGSDGEAATCQGTIADILFQRGDYDEALRIRREVQLPVFERLGDTRSAAVAWGKIADILYQRGDYDEAAELHLKALQVYETLGDLDGVASAKWGLAQIELAREDYNTAFPLLVDSFRLLQQLQRPDGVAVVGNMLGQILLAAGEPEQAITVLNVSLGAAERTGEVTLSAHLRELIEKVAGQQASP
jgi:tetratricopeptide (TPR) repeat protein